MVTYAVDAVSGITLVCVLAQGVLALCDAQSGSGDDLVEGVWAAREDFARVTMAVIVTCQYLQSNRSS
jgi:hypothetical protein